MTLSSTDLNATLSINDSQHKWLSAWTTLSLMSCSMLIFLLPCWVTLCWLSHFINMLSVLCWVSHFYYYVKCRYAECLIFIAMLSAVMLTVSFYYHAECCHVMLSVAFLKATLSVIMLTVSFYYYAECRNADCPIFYWYAECHYGECLIFIAVLSVDMLSVSFLLLCWLSLCWVRYI